MKAFVIFRDRVTYGRRCVAALTAAGLDVTIADHGSTWPAAITWLVGCEDAGMTVLWRGSGHPRSLWDDQRFRELCDGDRYVVTDPDVIPAEGCPLDWPARLSGLLDDYPGFSKAAPGLRIDNLPAHYRWRESVIGWEQKYWAQPLDGADAYIAPVDTTLAVYQPLGIRPLFDMHALRAAPPYVADHLGWHENVDELDPELAFYHDHAESGVSFWSAVAGPEHQR